MHVRHQRGYLRCAKRKNGPGCEVTSPYRRTGSDGLVDRIAEIIPTSLVLEWSVLEQRKTWLGWLTY